MRQAKGFSVNRLVEECEWLSPSVCMRLESESGAVTVSAIERDTEVLEIHPRELFNFDF